MKQTCGGTRVLQSCMALICIVAHAAPVAPTEDAIDASRAARAVTLSGGTATGSKSAARDESKTIDLLIDLQDRTAPKGDERRGLPEGRTARPTIGSGPGADTANTAAAAYFGVPAAAQGAKAQDTGRAEPDPSARRPTTAGGPQGSKPPTTESGLSAWLPRELLSWIRDHRYEVLAAALGTFALVWIFSAALVQRRH